MQCMDILNIMNVDYRVVKSLQFRVEILCKSPKFIQQSIIADKSLATHIEILSAADRNICTAQKKFLAIKKNCFKKYCGKYTEIYIS